MDADLAQRQKMGGLKPGEEKSFRLPFDTVPESWNQSMPGLVIPLGELWRLPEWFTH